MIFEFFLAVSIRTFPCQLVNITDIFKALVASVFVV